MDKDTSTSNNQPSETPTAGPPVPVVPMTPSPVQSQSSTDVMGIISLILAFTGLQLIGFIIGLIGVKKAKEEGRSTTLSKVGWILNLIMMIIAVAMIILFIVLGVFTNNAANNIKKSADTYQQQQKDDYNASTSSKKDYAAGETAQFGNLKVKVNNVTRNYVPTNEYERADTGKELIVVDLTVTNTGKDSEYVSDFDFNVEDNGLQVNSSFTAAPGTAFKTGNLTSGASTSGQIVYEVTAGATNLKLAYEDSVYNPSTYSTDKVNYTLGL